MCRGSANFTAPLLTSLQSHPGDDSEVNSDFTFRSETSSDIKLITSTPAKEPGSHTQSSECIDLSAISAVTSHDQSPVAPDFSDILGSNSQTMSGDENDISLHLMSPPTDETSPQSNWNGFKIVGDNVDKTIRPRDMCSDRQTKSVHYFQLYAVRDRVNLQERSDAPRPCCHNPPLDEVLQHLTTTKPIISNMSVLVARLLTTHMAWDSSERILRML